MVGHILLEGGAEFGGRMADADLRAMELAGGPAAPIRIIPTAAAPDDNHQRAGTNGERWFRSLGATNVSSVPLIDSASAESASVGDALQEARLIYLLGGFAHYLGQTLLGSPAWKSVLQAYEAGAVVAGSSAGAMVLCEHYYHPSQGQIQEGLGLVPNACVMPHHDAFGAGWADRLKVLVPDNLLIGIDERTGMLDDGAHGSWCVYGQGCITLYRAERDSCHPAGTCFALSE